MCTGDSKKTEVAVATGTKDYSPYKEKLDDQPPMLAQPLPSTPPPNGPLHIEKPSPDTLILLPPKGVVHNSSLNPHPCAAQNYSIVEDLAQ
jgi:hypothetical protein